MNQLETFFVSKLFIVLYTYLSIIYSSIIAMSHLSELVYMYLYVCLCGLEVHVCVCVCRSIYHIIISKNIIYEALDYILLYTDS